MKELVQINGRTDLFRDPSSMAVITRDRSKLEEARARKKAAIEEKQRIERMESDISDLKGSMGRIEEMLGKLLTRE